jgi:hypothetical protein
VVFKLSLCHSSITSLIIIHPFSQYNTLYVLSLLNIIEVQNIRYPHTMSCLFFFLFWIQIPKTDEKSEISIGHTLVLQRFSGLNCNHLYLSRILKEFLLRVSWPILTGNNAEFVRIFFLDEFLMTKLNINYMLSYLAVRCSFVIIIKPDV